MSKKLDTGDGSTGVPPRLVFEGTLADYAEAVAHGRLPACNSDALIKDGEVWRTVRKAMPVSGRPRPRRAQLALPNNPNLQRWWSMALDRSMGMQLARRIQPLIDRREEALIDILEKGDTFPYHSEHYVEGRILLGASSLYSGGAERQMVYTASGLCKAGYDDVHMLIEHLRDKPENAFYLPLLAPYVKGIHELGNDDLCFGPWVDANPLLANIIGSYVTNRILNAARVIQSVAPEVVQASLDWTNITMGTRGCPGWSAAHIAQR